METSEIEMAIVDIAAKQWPAAVVGIEGMYAVSWRQASNEVLVRKRRGQTENAGSGRNLVREQICHWSSRKQSVQIL